MSQELFQNDKLTSKIKLGFLWNASTLRRIMQKKKWNRLNAKYHLLFSNLNKLKFDFYILELY